MYKHIALAVILAGMTMLAESAPRPPWMTQLQTQNQIAEKADNLEREVLIQALLAMSRGNVASQHKLAENQQYPQRIVSQGLSAKNQQFPETTSQGRLPQYFPSFVQAASSRRPQSNEVALQAFGDPRGIEIVGCGGVGSIIESALRFGLGFIPGGDNNYGVYIQCPDPSYPCTTVQVAVPSGRNNMKADVDVCSRPDGSVCVEVYGGSDPNCNPVFAAPIPINVPVGSGRQVSVVIKIDALFSKCAAVEVSAPGC